jgi:hypothetical protein
MRTAFSFKRTNHAPNVPPPIGADGKDGGRSCPDLHKRERRSSFSPGGGDNGCTTLTNSVRRDLRATERGREDSEDRSDRNTVEGTCPCLPRGGGPDHAPAWKLTVGEWRRGGGSRRERNKVPANVFARGTARRPWPSRRFMPDRPAMWGSGGSGGRGAEPLLTGRCGVPPL